MAVPVDYRCTACGACTEHRVAQPIPPRRACDACGRPARRLFSIPRVARAAAEAGASRAGHAHDVPLACTLTETAARMLSARARADNRALEREIAYQESSIKAGTLDPTSSVVTTFPGGPAASTRAEPCQDA